MAFNFGNTSTLSNNNNVFPKPQRWPTKNDGKEHTPILVEGSQDDTISALNFNPKVDNSMTYMVASAWDGVTRVWEVNTQQVKTMPKAENKQNAPVLDNCWSTCGKKVYLACADNNIYCWDFLSNQCVQIGVHEAPVSCVNVLVMNGCEVIMTGSWDKTVKFWDGRNSTPIANLNIGYKVYGADACYPVAVAIGSDKKFSVIDFSNGGPQISETDKKGQKWSEKLNHQYSCVTLYKNKNNNYLADGFAIGCMEGRASLTYFDEEARKQIDPKNPRNSVQSNWSPNFAFKCHRIDNDKDKPIEAYTINFIKFHPKFQTLVTAGSDGTYAFWDKDNRQKLGPTYENSKIKHRMNLPLTAGDISADGKLFIFATGYDWSFGQDYSNLKANKPLIYIHPDFLDIAHVKGEVNAMTPKG